MHSCVSFVVVRDVCLLTAVFVVVLQGECKYTMDKDGHTDWVSCVRFPPATEDPVIVSCGWDKAVKVRAFSLPQTRVLPVAC